MALTGLVLVGFVLVHMAGNLQLFLGPAMLNEYANSLQSLPPPVLWGGRLFLLVCVGLHVLVAVQLTARNRAARPDRYEAEDTVVASFSSRVMPVTGLIVLAFIIFHILHFTTRNIFDYDNMVYTLHDGTNQAVVVHDVYAMMLAGFSVWYVSLFYVVSMALLCSHLSHGVSSMFQSLGLRNERWRYTLNKLAVLYGWLIFLGFISIPVAVTLGYGKGYLEERQQYWENQPVLEEAITSSPEVLNR